MLGSASRGTILVVDDDVTLSNVMARGLAQRGFDVKVAHSVGMASQLARDQPPEHALIDLQLPDGNGLQLLRRLREFRADTKVVLLTGYGSIPSSIDAIKLGATFYLCKPAVIDDIVQAFSHTMDAAASPAPSISMPSMQRVQWEHIQHALARHEGCISAAARALNMHRRTLQRKLGKNPPRA